MQDHTANQHWCRYDTSFLDVDCHATSTTCTAAYAYCIKRASGTGGCDTVAETLRCRGLQADHLDTTLTVSAKDVYRQGCTPCVVLPFEAVSTGCPGELHQSPSRTGDFADRTRFDWAHTYKEDFLEGDRLCVEQAHDSGVMDPNCLNRRRCSDPPRGRIVWESNHHSGVAVVNSPITLSIEDIPNRTRTVHFFSLGYHWWNMLRPNSTLVYEYPDTTSGDPVVRTWYRVDPSRTYTTVDYTMMRGECRISAWPDFRVLIEELWPDNDEVAIRDLFGTSSLGWWTALSSSEQQQHTQARGPMYVQEIRCNQGDDVWCRWTPPRSGYYRLTAAGGWRLDTHSGRLWLFPHQVTSVETFLRNVVSSGDGDCPYDADDFSFAGGYGRGRDYDCIMDYLGIMGLQPDEAGLQDDSFNKEFTGLVSRRPDQDYEWLYSDASGDNYTCPPRDLRASCGSSGGAVNYTESESIGIIVHEVQVHTVTPAR